MKIELGARIGARWRLRGLGITAVEIARARYHRVRARCAVEIARARYHARCAVEIARARYHRATVEIARARYHRGITALGARTSCPHLGAELMRRR